MAADYSIPTPPETQYAHVLYVIEDESRAVKIGVTADLRMRLYSLRSANSRPIHIRALIYCDDETQVLALEGLLHSRYASFHLRGEWFDVSINRVLDDLLFALRVAGLQIPQQSGLGVLNCDASTRMRHYRTPDGQKRVVEYLTDNPDDAALPLRALAERIGVNKDTVNAGRKLWHETRE